jgi:AraC-like DNA-binding protein
MTDYVMQRLHELLEQHLVDEGFRMPQLCRALYMSRAKMFRQMKSTLGSAPTRYIRSYRLHRARTLLETTDYKIAEIAFRVGFNDPAYFSRAFRKEFGCRPRTLRH